MFFLCCVHQLDNKVIYEDLSSGNRIVSCGRPADMTKLIVVFLILRMHPHHPKKSKKNSECDMK